jgi:hypothetical protein
VRNREPGNGLGDRDRGADIAVTRAEAFHLSKGLSLFGSENDQIKE